jgi:hypothetical protein
MLYHIISHWQSSIIIIFSNQPERCVVCAALVVVQRVTMIESDRWIDYSLPHSAFSASSSGLVARQKSDAE